VVIFEEFGDNSLVFTVYFWLECTTYMDFRIVASDIRYRIDKLFREAGITIAFPQRDVHFDIEKPIRVQIAEGEPPEENSDSPKGKLPG
jgi:small-conductance mechanosensitive channel